MNIDESKLRDALRSIHSDPLTRAEAAAIVDVARFAASVDGRMDMGEMATVARISKILYAMCGEEEVPVPSTPMAAGWLNEIGRRLTSPGPRELAYASARVIILSDRKVTKEETELAKNLSETLRLGEARAQALDQIIDALARDAR